MQALLAKQLLHKQLIPESLWQRLVTRVTKDASVTQEEAEDIVDGVIGFLKLSADHPGNAFAPSRKVDIGWHVFLMYTREYADFCQQIGRRFIHHRPNDDSNQHNNGNARQTIAFMQLNGIPYNPKTWIVKETEKADCDCENGCDIDCVTVPS